MQWNGSPTAKERAIAWYGMGRCERNAGYVGKSGFKYWVDDEVLLGRVELLLVLLLHEIRRNHALDPLPPCFSNRSKMPSGMSLMTSSENISAAVGRTR